MSTQKIVITGGPSTGKTSVINLLEKMGFTCLHEVIRSMTLEQKNLHGVTDFKTNPIVSVSDPIAFNQKILNARLEQFETAMKSDDEMVFFDRGLPDVIAYMECFGQEYHSDFIEACVNNRYDVVFLMSPWKEIHISDGERFENFEESLKVNECLFDCYTNLGYTVEIVPKDTVDKRVDFILERINRSR